MSALLRNLSKDSKEKRAQWLAINILPCEKALRSWLLQKYSSRIDVDDVVQDMYAALASLESVDHIRNPRSYAFRTAYSVVRSQFERAKIVSFRAAADYQLDKVFIDSPSPEEVAEEREELRNVTKALDQLPPDVRKVFVLRRVHGYSQREISLHLGISENIVEKHVGKGVRLLVEIFGRGGK